MTELIPLQPDLLAARWQMALSLGWHIVVASFGVGFPALILVAEMLGLRRGDDVYLALARRWAKAAGVLFAVGAVSGTILSFEMGILWPGLIGTYGEVIGIPFALEGVAFFIEAIFLGIYLYGWDRLPPRAHLLSGVPIPLAGIASAWFVVTANAWMNQPAGFRLVEGRVVDVDPIAAMLNPATGVQTTHMIVAAFMVTGFGVASVYAWAMLRGRGGAYERRGFLIAFVAAALLTAPQIAVGDWAAQFLAAYQPTKLAAIEGLYESQRRAPLTIGGLPVDGEMRYGIQIPGALSWLAFRDVDAQVQGLDAVRPEERPPVLPVHVAFQLMVAIGVGLLSLSVWLAWSWWRRRAIPTSRLFLAACVAAGPAAVVALEAGWIVTEVGRQPWIVYQVMRVEEAVTAAPGIRYGFYALIVLYAALTVAAVFVLGRLAAVPLAVADELTPRLPARSG
ncbi:MAG TPA: cytochrome ubiquinol oxidase subunit I [Candidatus Limnocylindria bacterium]|nr:cytochrome ubiquinol oxidase subunit I [Candidatus Limnocylindria bacterium]